MKTIILLTLTCAEPKIENKTEWEWNDHDQSVKEYSIKRCPELYPEAPCLSRIIKVGKQDYHVLCGEKLEGK